MKNKTRSQSSKLQVAQSKENERKKGRRSWGRVLAEAKTKRKKAEGERKREKNGDVGKRVMSEREIRLEKSRRRGSKVENGRGSRR